MFLFFNHPTQPSCLNTLKQQGESIKSTSDTWGGSRCFYHNATCSDEFQFFLPRGENCSQLFLSICMKRSRVSLRLKVKDTEVTRQKRCSEEEFCSRAATQQIRCRWPCWLTSTVTEQNITSRDVVQRDLQLMEAGSVALGASPKGPHWDDLGSNPDLLYQSQRCNPLRYQLKKTKHIFIRVKDLND